MLLPDSLKIVFVAHVYCTLHKWCWVVSHISTCLFHFKHFKGTQVLDFPSHCFLWFFYTKKPFRLGDFKYKLFVLILGGARHHLIKISSLCACSVHASVLFMRMLSIFWSRDLFKFWIFTLKLSICVINWCVCSGYASAPDSHAQCKHMHNQGTHLFLTRMLNMFWRDWAQCTQ